MKVWEVSWTVPLKEGQYRSGPVERRQLLATESAADKFRDKVVEAAQLLGIADVVFPAAYEISVEDE